MKLKAAFMFVAPEADYNIHKSLIETPALDLTVIGVKNYKDAEAVALQLVSQGIAVIELCGGFGNEGTAIVSKAVSGKASVGSVKFDNHPGLGFKSGDELFK